MRRHRAPSAALALVVLAALAVGPAGAACAAPTVEVSDVDVAPASRLLVTGVGFRGCDDTDDAGGGCLGRRSRRTGTRPDDDVALDLVQGDRRWRLAVVDADDDGHVRAEVVLPGDVAAGPATIEAPGADPAPLVVRPG